MVDETSNRFDRWLAWMRGTLLVLTGLVTCLWVSSYFVAFDRYTSTWTSTESGRYEEARWVISNFGSFGYAWRSQQSPADDHYPAIQKETQFKRIEASPSALQHIHPEGVVAWHWLQLHSAEERRSPTVRHEYGHIFVPYWMMALAGGLLMLVTTSSSSRQARPRMEVENPL